LELKKSEVLHTGAEISMTYQSPFTIRYASDEMRSLWSERALRILWRRVWIAVAEAQTEAGLVSSDQLDDLKEQATNIDLERALKIENEIGHDLVAELKTFAEQCPLGGKVLHWGLTSADIKDNADVIRQRAALALLLRQMKDLLLKFATVIESTSHIPIMGYTHLQTAEPTTLGYRLASYAQDLMIHYENLGQNRKNLRGKGIRGSVGTAATFVDMLVGSPTDANSLETEIMGKLGLQAFPVSNQTYPRIQDYILLGSLAGLTASLHKFAIDVRILQSPGFSVLAEPFGDKQVGSSAMPFKRNPEHSETVCSLARLVIASVSTAWQNAAYTLLERTLDDSANRRSIIPEAFLACDEILHLVTEIISGLEIDELSIKQQLEIHGPFAAVERVLTALVQQGADRQEMHERLRQHSMRAWEAIRNGNTNPLIDLLCADTALLKYLQPTRIRSLMEIQTYLGLAPQKATEFALQIRHKFIAPETSDEPK
jgi:adenylosuccinate lyase